LGKGKGRDCCVRSVEKGVQKWGEGFTWNRGWENPQTFVKTLEPTEVPVEHPPPPTQKNPHPRHTGERPARAKTIDGRGGKPGRGHSWKDNRAGFRKEESTGTQGKIEWGWE